MHQKPRIWRAWHPVVFQLAGILILAFSPLLPTLWAKGLAATTGLLVWVIGFGYRKSN